MTYATHVLRHSKKIGSSSNLIRHDSAVLARWFSNGTRPSMEKGDDILRCQSGLLSGERHNIPKSFNRCYSGSAVSNNSCRTVSPRMSCGNALRTTIAPCTSTGSMSFIRRSSGSQAPSRRGFSTASDLPPHQAIGMPSLSPTMTERFHTCDAGKYCQMVKERGR